MPADPIPPRRNTSESKKELILVGLGITVGVLAWLWLLFGPSLPVPPPPYHGYMVHGRTLESALDEFPDSKYFRNLAKTVHIIPDVKTCLLPAVDNAPARLNLETITDTRKLEVCLFWIAQALGDLDEMSALLSHNGFRVSKPITSIGTATVNGKREWIPTTNLGAGMPIEAVPIPLGWLARKAAYSLSLSIVYDADLKVREVQVILNTK